jgi:transcriptional regulator with XRE-family HTH domain
MHSENFSIVLKKLRKENSLKQKNLADIMNVSYQTIGHLECDYRKPSYELLLKLADYFNVSIDYLVGRTDNPDINK